MTLLPALAPRPEFSGKIGSDILPVIPDPVAIPTRPLREFRSKQRHDLNSIDLDDSIAHGIKGDIRDRMQVELAHQVGPVSLRCLDAKA